ncbi:winged helix-turn-helix domain-containing protein [Thermoplasma sp.]|uniref:winged helix-turn-helix domain-containing protein n=1 Tax=Thermoplasma sp. TaxID=1973142 RepID=UPI00261D89A1|nr:winged helix-turn-helix domain-containing protein [Thermoplasma sp.]
MDEITRNIDLLLKNFSNRTRLMIISLIIKNGPMTVTDLSKVIKTSRSNLYQLIKDMLSDGVIVQSKTEVKKNYVEKYYSINESLFASVKSEDLRKAITIMDDESFRNLLISFLTTASAMMSIAAEQISIATEDDMRNYREEINGDHMIMSFASLSKENMAKYSKMHAEFMSRIENENDHSLEDHFLYVIGFPSIPNKGSLNRNVTHQQNGS